MKDASKMIDILANNHWKFPQGKVPAPSSSPEPEPVHAGGDDEQSPF
jgi:hypothetical protein